MRDETLRASADAKRQPMLSRTHPVWRGVGDALLALIVVFAAFAPFADSGAAAEGPGEFALALAPAVALPWRRRWPVLVLAVNVLLAVSAVLVGMVPFGAIFATVVSMFTVADRSSRRRTLVVLGATAVATSVFSLLASIGGLFDPRTFVTLAWIVIAAAAGDATRSRRAYLQAITDRAIRAEQTRDAEARRRVSEERLRIARDLHDAVAHQISVISLNAGVASASLETRPEKTREALATIRTASRAVLGEIGELMAMLRADDDAETAPHASLRQLVDLVAAFRQAGLEVAVRIEGDLPELPMATDAVAYRVLQEGLTNALKHGIEGRAHILVRTTAEALHIVVTNPAGPSEREDSGGYGLLGLRERVAAVRGVVEAGGTAAGYRLSATLPLSREEAGA
ncbi:sensor histidine kinase [Microbacterium sp. RD1]|uniref:sensor histidine kinase n=1 Tax=Microbacterium sp. RD1 TaxID=3457313 RepID=UPI003FA5AAD8